VAAGSTVDLDFKIAFGGTSPPPVESVATSLQVAPATVAQRG